jgi:hypothetical protein
VSHDPRISYLSGKKHPIIFKASSFKNSLEECLKMTDGVLYCSLRHPPTKMCFYNNHLPFSCSLCCKFVGVFKYGLEFARCERCATTVCPKCLLKHEPTMKRVYLERHLDLRKLEPFLLQDPTSLCEFHTQK